MITGKHKVIVIPARMGASRLPGKPLRELVGRPLLQWTYDKASQTKADLVMVATPDNEIADYCHEHGIHYEMTDVDLPNGTSRCAQAIERVYGNRPEKEVERVVNWQVDEPLVCSEYVDELLDDTGYWIGTLIAERESHGELTGQHIVKTIVNEQRRLCIWFTRHDLPYTFLHCGIYSFNPFVLMEVAALPVTELSEHESLEQLTWLENDYRIKPTLISKLPLSINTEEDVEKFSKEIHKR